MQEPNETQLVREATDIFLRLRDNPDDPALLQERDRFIERGEAESAAYAKMLKVWKVTDPGKRSGPTTLSSVFVAGALIVTGYLAYDPIRVMLIADVSTDRETRAAQLVSGDRVVLDAASAIIDDSDGATRSVTLIEGAAFFDVQPDDRPFMVTAGAMQVEVVGTSFEVSQTDDGDMVAVSEGLVDVTIGDQLWELSAGERLRWSDQTGARLTKMDVAAVAGWRDDILVADGMTFAQILAVLERRMPGRVLVTSSSLEDAPIVGTFDLRDPVDAIELLAELTGANVTRVPYVLTVISP